MFTAGQDGVEEFLGCGNVVQEHYVEVGAEKRNFEGKYIMHTLSTVVNIMEFEIMCKLKDIPATLQLRRYVALHVLI